MTHAEAASDLKGIIISRELNVGAVLAQIIGKSVGAVLIVARKDYGKFFAAEASDDPGDLIRLDGDRSDNGVSNLVAVMIVDLLEMVDVEHDGGNQIGVTRVLK